MILDTNGIQQRLAHRYPFLLIDRVIELEEGVSCTAIKNISFSEPCFQGHFPGQPIFPGVMIIEAMAQTAGIAGYGIDGVDRNSLSYFAGIDKVKFRKPVVPGDQLVLKTVFTKRMLKMWFIKAEAYVDNVLVTSAELKLAIVSGPKAT